MKTFFKNSKKERLDIEVLSTSDPRCLSGFLAEHVHRVRSLRVDEDEPGTTLLLLQAISGQTAPMLSEISLAGSPEVYKWNEDTRRVQLLAGPGSAPNVQAVRMTSIPVEWASLPFDNLHVLELSNFLDGETA